MRNLIMPVSIGLDFGTYQTKACVRFKRSNNIPAEYHFVPMREDKSGMDAFFLPSVISETDKGQFIYGRLLDNSQFTFSFFKIASAEDENFRLDAKLTEPKYAPERFKPYTPEFLSVVYLAYVINKIKDYVQNILRPGKSETVRKGYLAKFQSEEYEQVTYEWTIQMGVPTEYQERYNSQRRRKFQQILYMASELANVDNGRLTETATADTLQHRVAEIFYELLQRFHRESVLKVREDEWKTFLHEKRLSLFPETGAGLYFLIKAEKLTKDKYYVALDIGGGSTDVSFFKVETDNTFTYLASKSSMIASNDIGMDFFGKETSHSVLRAKLKSLFSNPLISTDPKYSAAFKHVLSKINKHVYRMFNSPQVFRRFELLNATEIYEDTTCYIYGGGALMPVAQPNPEGYLSKIEIHNNGEWHSLTTKRTYVYIRPIRELKLNENIQPPNWEEKMDFLIVPLGLSLALSDDIITRLEKNFYTREDLKKATSFYDVRSAKWV